MQHRALRFLLPLLLLFPVVPPAQAAIFSRLDASTSRLVASVFASARAAAPTAGVSVASGVSLMAVDADGIRAFRASPGGGRLSVPAADGSTLELDLAPYDLFGPGGPGQSLSTTDAHGRHLFTPDVTLYRGQVAGEPGSWAVFAMGDAGVFGTLEHGGTRYNLGPSQIVTAGRAAMGTALPPHALAPESARAADATPFKCGIDDSNEAQLTRPLVLPPGIDATGPLFQVRGATTMGKVGTSPSALIATRTVWKIAVDCDYEVFHDKFADNLTAASSYVLTVLGTVNLIYERDLAATLTFPFVNLWTTVADPYSASTTGSQLTQFQGYWIVNHPTVARSAAFLMSGRPLGGGISIIGSLCDPQSAYALAALDFVYTYPTATSTWDVTVTAHELGHVFGSWHTQSCNWASQGFAPAATTLDSCFASEGGCATYTKHLPPNKGTIMSYCHVVYGVANGIRLDFHPVCVQRMRAVMSVAACSTQAVPQPPRNATTAPLGNGVRVSWTAGGSASVLGYEVYRSRVPLDVYPTRAGFSSTLQWDDAGLGTYYYRVRSVRASDTSAFCPEVIGTAPCGMTTGVAASAGSAPVAGLAADLNADGREDAVVLRGGDNTLGLLFGQGTGAVGNGTLAAPVAMASALTPGCIAVSELTGDGIPDLLVGAQGDNSLRLHRGNATAGVPNGTFGFASGLGTLLGTPRAVAIADVDEDGIDDILTATDATVVRMRGLGTAGVANGTFGIKQSTPVGMSCYDLAVHDFDADGVLDLAVSGDGGLRILRGVGNNGRGDGSFALPTAYAAGVSPGRLAVADLNADGADDIVVCDRGDSLVRVFVGNRTAGVPNGTFSTGVAYGAGPAPSAITVVDWDHDGLPDIVVANNTVPGTVSVLTSKGDGTLAPRFFVPTGGDSVSALITTDYDEDGSLDVLAVNKTSGSYERVTTTCPGTLSDAVTLLAPNGGETWATQEERAVSWTKGAGVLSVDVQLSTDSGGHWRNIARELTGTSWKWSVASATTTHARLRVTAHGLPQWNDASNADFTVVPGGSLAVDDGPPRLALLGCWPNPASHELTVSFALPAGAHATGGTLELVDLLGRRVAGHDLTGLGAGSHQVALLEHQTLPPGVYLVRLKCGADIRLSKVAVVR